MSIRSARRTDYRTFSAERAMAAVLMRLDTSLRNCSLVATKGRFLAARPVSRSPMKRYAEATAAKLRSSFMSTARTGRYFDQDSDHAFFGHPLGHSAPPKASWIAWPASFELRLDDPPGHPSVLLLPAPHAVKAGD